MANGFQPRSGILNPINVIGFSELGRSAAVQGMSDVLTLQRQQMENEQLLPLQIEALRLQNENREFELETMNPIRAQNMRMGNQIQRQQHGLNAYKLQTAGLAAEREQLFHKKVLDGYNQLFDPQTKEFKQEEGRQWLDAFGGTILQSQDRDLMSLRGEVRQKLGLPAEAGGMLGEFQRLSEGGDVEGLRRLEQRVTFDPSVSEGQRQQIVGQIQDERIRLGDTSVVTQAGVSPTAMLGQANRIAGLQAEAGSLELQLEGRAQDKEGGFVLGARERADFLSRHLGESHAEAAKRESIARQGREPTKQEREQLEELSKIEDKIEASDVAQATEEVRKLEGRLAAARAQLAAVPRVTPQGQALPVGPLDPSTGTLDQTDAFEILRQKAGIKPPSMAPETAPDGVDQELARAAIESLEQRVSELEKEYENSGRKDTFLLKRINDLREQIRATAEDAGLPMTSAALLPEKPQS